MSGTVRTRRLKNWERKRRGDAPRAPRRRSHRRGRMSRSQSAAAPRASEELNVLGSGDTIDYILSHDPRNVRAHMTPNGSTVILQALRFLPQTLNNDEPSGPGRRARDAL